MSIYILTPTGITTCSPHEPGMGIRMRIEAQKGNHVIDQHGQYLEPPISTSAPWFTGTNSEGR